MTDLTSLAEKYGTDKTGIHFYTQHYETHFGRFRNEKINLLEIGVGGYEKPDEGGESLRMWKEYFPHGNIYSLDVYDKRQLEEERIRIFQGSQVDRSFLESMVNETGPLDIIIDDGSHLNDHVIRTFEILFPLLKEGGIYAVEDVQTSYWPDHGGDSFNLRKNHTTMNYFKGLADGINYEEFDNPYYQPTYFDRHIVSIHFYHNLIFIHKGMNNEGSGAACADPIRKKKNRRRLKYMLRCVFSKIRGG